MRVAYVVSRFPHVSETFIVRELDAVSDAGLDVELLSLFPAVSETVHPAAARWVPRLRRGRVSTGLAAFGWWLLRRPLRLLSSSLIVCAAYARRPALAVRALVTVVVACQHARALRADPVDHVHAHYATYPALAAWLIWRMLGVPYSFTAHAHDLYVDQSMLTRKVSDARFVVAISDFNRLWLADHAGGPRRTPVEVVHCGIELGEYRFHAQTLPTQGPVTAVCVASLQEYKGHEFLLRALAGDRRLDRIRLELVGEGERRLSLQRLAAELRLADRVRFMGARQEAEVGELLATADLFVLPSVVAADGQMEGLPVALMEAMASGVPVVASRLSGIPELVVDGETGLLAAPGDPGALAEALAEVLADPEAAARRAEKGRRAVETAFDVRETGARMAELLELGGEVSGRRARPEPARPPSPS
jgi:glycosyltransferase involved in cell wall biosynthesis